MLLFMFKHLNVTTNPMNKKVKHNVKIALYLAIANGILIMTQAYAADFEHNLDQETDSLIFNTNTPSKELMRVTGKGKVGINTPNPSTQLHIKSDGIHYPDRYNIKFTDQDDETIFGFNPIDSHLGIHGLNPTLNFLGDDNSYYPGINFYGKDGPLGRFLAYHRRMIYAFNEHWFEGTNGGHFMKITSAGVGIGVGRWPNDPGNVALTSKLQVVGLKEYNDNNDAISRGHLTNGAFYRTGDFLKVVHD